jgi:hypothetical protein
MATKQERANRSMLTQEESEEHDNANTIDSNRKQFKTIGYNGFNQKYIGGYKEETNAFLKEQGSSGTAVSIEHNTADTNRGDMEIFVITVTNPNDRDLILGLIDGHAKLTYTGATAGGNNLNFGRRGRLPLLQLGQLTKNGKRIPFKAKRGNTGMRDNPEYMKAWAATACTMGQQGRRQILKGFWPLIDSAEVIERNSPDKKPKAIPNVWGMEPQTWKKRKRGEPKHLRRKRTNKKKDWLPSRKKHWSAH